MCLRESRTQAPIAQVAQVGFEQRVQDQVRGVRAGHEDVVGVVRPVEGDGGSVGDEEVVEGNRGVDPDQLVAHLRPGQVVDPGRVRCEQLGWAGCEPLGQLVVRLLRRPDLPAHE